MKILNNIKLDPLNIFSKNRARTRKSVITFLTKSSSISANKLIEQDIKSKLTYLRMDSKSNFTKIDTEDINAMNEKLTKYNDDQNDLFDNTNLVLDKFINKICGKSDGDAFDISKIIGEKLEKNKKLSKDKISDIINSLVYDGSNTTRKNKKSNTLILDKDSCISIGSILCYSYSRIGSYKIKDMEKLKELKNRTIQNNVNVLSDYHNYLKEQKLSYNDVKISRYWKKHRNNYECLPEVLFLINEYSKITTVEIDLSKAENFNEDEMNFFLITLMNINWFLNLLTDIKINLISMKLEDALYSYYHYKLYEILTNKGKEKESLKKNYFSNEISIYKKKWDFKNNFQLAEIEKQRQGRLTTVDFSKKNKNTNNIPISKSVDIANVNLSFGRISNVGFSKTKNSSILSGLIEENNFESSLVNLDPYDEKGKQKYVEIVKNNNRILELILMILFSLNDFNESINLELVMNDCFKKEINSYFKTNFSITDEEKRNINDFHVFDLLLINNKISKIYELNLEINTLDSLTFDKILNIIHKNDILNSLKISFFSSDVTYLSQSIYKIYVENFGKDQLFQYSGVCEFYLFNNNYDTVVKMLDEFSVSFISNLSLLFEMIINKKKLTKLGFNFSVPGILISKENYMLPILKFIINILCYISNIKSNNNKCKTLCILSPYTSLDMRIIPNLNKIIQNIDFQNNKCLEELTIHMQMNKIVKISNFIGYNLKTLCIGELDFVSFETLINHLCKYDFNKNSSLENLTIGLSKNILEFTTDIKILFRKLFNIKISSLVTMNLYTNIIIENKISYFYLLNILNNNWIPTYNVILNAFSSNILYKYKKELDNLKYFVSHDLENKLLEPVDKSRIKKNEEREKEIMLDPKDEIFWYLKYLFNNVYIDSIKNEERNKILVSGILKYLYIEKTPHIEHSLK